jgi:hypothetical protein
MEKLEATGDCIEGGDRMAADWGGWGRCNSFASMPCSVPLFVVFPSVLCRLFPCIVDKEVDCEDDADECSGSGFAKISVFCLIET